MWKWERMCGEREGLGDKKKRVSEPHSSFFFLTESMVMLMSMIVLEYICVIV